MDVPVGVLGKNEVKPTSRMIPPAAKAIPLDRATARRIFAASCVGSEPDPVSSGLMQQRKIGKAFVFESEPDLEKRLSVSGATNEPR